LSAKAPFGTLGTGSPAVMKPALAAVLVLLAAPGVARAEVTISARDVPLQGGRTLASSTHRAFDMVGLHWRGSGSVQFRTRSLVGRWSAWHAAAPESEDLPDVGTAERAAGGAWRLGNPYWVGASDSIAYRLRGHVTRLRAYFVNSPSDGLPPRRLSIADSPPIITRLSWGADEKIRRAAPQFAPAVAFGLVHHTAGSNSYSPSQSAAIVRGIEVYHVKANGWNDIGYNFLVDRYGQVFEGRFGGVGRNVIGAHAEGFNTGSFGVAVLGTYGDAPPPAAAQNALADVLAWRLDVAHVDPLSRLTWTSGGNARFPVGTPVFLRAISGHRDTGPTTCPGNALYARLGAIAAKVAAEGLPKLYAASAMGDVSGLVRFRARLSELRPWTVTVTGPDGAVVASGSGTSSEIDWTWDAATAPKARYAWSISAGDDVRPATGFIGAAPVALRLTKPTAKPATISPNGDGQQDTSTISYTLSATATVTAVLRAPDGRQLATLFNERRSPGTRTFVFTAGGVPDGRYEIVLSATDGRATVTAVIPVVVDRTVAGWAVTPKAFSPNGDGRRDTVTLAYSLAQPASVRIEVKTRAKVVVPVFAGTPAPGPQSLTWDGTGPTGRVPDGRYAAVLTTATGLGTTVHSIPVRLDTRRPVLRAISFRRLSFRVDEPVRVTAVADGRRIMRSVRAGAFSLGRTARRVSISAEDPAGNVSRVLRSP
jgi:N-acetylmuramoyl-L-alanine amidase